MSISTGGLAALLAVVSLALSSCGSDDAPSTPSPATAAQAPAVTTTATATATATATTTAPRTTGSTSTTTKAAEPSAPEQTSPEPKPEPESVPAQDSGVCPGVELGQREGDIESTFAKITTAKGISCEGAATVVVQWGQQAIGLQRATVPLGWECRTSNVCTNGSMRVAFTLVPPSE